ncbi:MAG: hypothetical protein ACTSU5_16620, partial [Promethearchaeota archaeon]
LVDLGDKVRVKDLLEILPKGMLKRSEKEILQAGDGERESGVGDLAGKVKSLLNLETSKDHGIESRFIVHERGELITGLYPHSSKESGGKNTYGMVKYFFIFYSSMFLLVPIIWSLFTILIGEFVIAQIPQAAQVYSRTLSLAILGVWIPTCILMGLYLGERAVKVNSNHRDSTLLKKIGKVSTYARGRSKRVVFQGMLLVERDDPLRHASTLGLSHKTARALAVNAHGSGKVQLRFEGKKLRVTRREEGVGEPIDVLSKIEKAVVEAGGKKKDGKVEKAGKVEWDG